MWLGELLLCSHVSIPNLEPGSQAPVVSVRGRSLMPYCHFELEDSDYIRSGRRNPDLPGPALDPSTRTIEFMSTGVGVRCPVKFDVINPTNQNYSFAWKCVDEVNTKQFVCHCTSGVINSGKKIQVSKWCFITATEYQINVERTLNLPNHFHFVELL